MDRWMDDIWINGLMTDWNDGGWMNNIWMNDIWIDGCMNDNNG